jgi:hypothetical protein
MVARRFSVAECDERIRRTLYEFRRAELLPDLSASNYAAYPIPICMKLVDYHRENRALESEKKMLGTLLIVLLVLALLGAFPRWGYSRDWGYWPSGGVGFVLLIVIILALMGRI